MRSFKEYQSQRTLNEQWIVIDHYKFLKNPTAKNLEQFVLKVHKKENDFDLRGISDKTDIFWAEALLLTHFDMAKLLYLDYNKCERLTAYKDHYGNIIIDFSQSMINNPKLLQLGLDDERFLPIQTNTTQQKSPLKKRA